MSTQRKRGFTLIELMVVIVIIGILAAIAIPKLFGMTAKAKAQEVGPAAGTWVKLHQAYMTEYGINNIWDSIGYTPPGDVTGDGQAKIGTSTYFVYSQDGATTESGVANIGTWKGLNSKGALGNGCNGSEWDATLTYQASAKESDMPTYTATGAKMAAGEDCEKLTPNFKNLGKTAGGNTDP